MVVLCLVTLTDLQAPRLPGCLRLWTLLTTTSLLALPPASPAGGLQAACGRRFYWPQHRQATWQTPWNWTHVSTGPWLQAKTQQPIGVFGPVIIHVNGLAIWYVSSTCCRLHYCGRLRSLITLRVIQLHNGVKSMGLLHRFYNTLLEWKWRRLLLSFLVRGADHMLNEESQWTENGTMFVDLDWLMNASSLLASAELLVLFVCHAPRPERRSFEGCIVRTGIALPFIGRFRRGLQCFFSEGIAV